MKRVKVLGRDRYQMPEEHPVSPIRHDSLWTATPLRFGDYIVFDLDWDAARQVCVAWSGLTYVTEWPCSTEQWATEVAYWVARGGGSCWY